MCAEVGNLGGGYRAEQASQIHALPLLSRKRVEVVNEGLRLGIKRAIFLS